MSDLNFHTLHHNLTETYAAINAQVNGNAPLLLAPVSHTSVYYRKSWLGQLVIAWHRLWRWILHELTPDLDTTIQNIIKVFEHAVLAAYEARQERVLFGMHALDALLPAQPALEQRTRYALFLAKDLKDSWWGNHPAYLDKFDERQQDPLNQKQAIQLRHLGINFQQATHVFWKWILKNQVEDKCAAFIESALPKKIQQQISPLLDHAFFKTLKKEFRWLHFESVLEQPLPLVALAKLHDPSSLKLEEKQQLANWIEAINRHHNKLSPKLFAVVLTEALKVIQLQGASPVTLPDILYWLSQHNCKLIEQECPRHMDWREKLRSGDIIKCNGKNLELGKQVSPVKEIDDVYKIFELKNYPNYVVKIAHNRFRLFVEAKQIEDEETHWGMRFVETIEDVDGVPGLDQEGFCVVQEKLKDSFANHKWTSNGVFLTDEDEQYALVLANHLYCMHQWQASAQNLSFAHLMWDQAGVLKTTRPLKKGPPNYIEWEEDCIRAAKGNVHILNFLMHVSKLYEHDMAEYYQRAVEYTLETGEIDLVERPLPIGHRESYYEQHAQQLCQQALKIRHSCCKHVLAHLRKEQNVHKTAQQIEQNVIDQMLRIYRSSSTPGRFSDHFQQDVISSMIEKPAPSILRPLDHKGYYQRKYELMMQKNRAAAEVEKNELAADEVPIEE